VRSAAERTRLAWERSALGPLAAAALLLAKRLDPPLGAALLAGADVALALTLLGLGRRRSRRIARAQTASTGTTVVPAALPEVLGVAAAAAVIALSTALFLAVGT
jgi:uncharacterized membrane protein YidH (DUF202 family)